MLIKLDKEIIRKYQWQLAIVVEVHESPDGQTVADGALDGKRKRKKPVVDEDRRRLKRYEVRFPVEEHYFLYANNSEEPCSEFQVRLAVNRNS